jgi:hypothetical protein
MHTERHHYGKGLCKKCYRRKEYIEYKIKNDIVIKKEKNEIKDSVKVKSQLSTRSVKTEKKDSSEKSILQKSLQSQSE